jgi:hypothetical protein
MEGLQIRQGTVYRKTADGSRFILINHNPMQLQSMRLHENGNAWDVSAPEIITVDGLIELRRSGEYEETGDISPEEFKQLAEALLAADSLPEDEAGLIRSLIS